MLGRIKKARSWFFEEINRVDHPLPRLIKESKMRKATNKHSKGKTAYMWLGQRFKSK